MFKYYVLLNALAVVEVGAVFRHKPPCWKQNQEGRVSPGICTAVEAPGGLSRASTMEPWTRGSPGDADPSDSLQEPFLFVDFLGKPKLVFSSKIYPFQ